MEEKKEEIKKELILKALEKEIEISTGKIAYLISTNYYKTNELLEELGKEKKIEMIDKPRGIYWKLKEVKNESWNNN